MEREIEYAEIYPAVYKLTGAFFTLDDADAFLSRMEVNKCNSTRFVCWLIAFGLLPPHHDKWATGLYSLYRQYWDLVSAKFPDPMQPLSAVDEATGTVLSCDLSRGINWFHMLASELQISDFYTGDAELRATRVLCALTLGVPGFSYCQGYDRYMFVNYLIALDFCAQSGLPAQFAEALAFPLVNEFIKMTRISHYLENPAETEEHFSNMDRVMAVACPETMELLREMQQGSIHFALRWELLLFADEYNARPLMLLWDQILHRRSQYKGFLFGLCIAHVKQVPVAGPDEIMIEKIQQFRAWNLHKIVSDAMVYLESEQKSPWRFVTAQRVIMLLMFIIVLLWLIILNVKEE